MIWTGDLHVEEYESYYNYDNITIIIINNNCYYY